MDLVEIKDECRRNLNRYTRRAFSLIPEIDRPVILDAGCGTGVPSMAIIELCDGTIHAVDPDLSAINRFKEKIAAAGLNDRITLYHDSILNPSLFDFKFDIVLAEGLLNVIGFERGMRALIRHLGHGGYLILHDEFRDDVNKRSFFKKKRLNLAHSFELNEDVWIQEYFNCLKSGIIASEDKDMAEIEMKSVNENLNDPKNLRSIYYILRSEA